MPNLVQTCSEWVQEQACKERGHVVRSANLCLSGEGSYLKKPVKR